MSQSNPSSMDERRHYQRVQFDTQAVLSQQNHSTPVHVVDLSLNGVLVDTFDGGGFDLSQPLQLHLELSDSVVIAMELNCAHHSSVSESDHQLRCGFRCTRIDLDSISHLRRLVELNLGSADALDRDLSQLIGKG